MFLLWLRTFHSWTSFFLLLLWWHQTSFLFYSYQHYDSAINNNSTHPTILNLPLIEICTYHLWWPLSFLILPDITIIIISPWTLTEDYTNIYKVAPVLHHCLLIDVSMPSLSYLHQYRPHEWRYDNIWDIPLYSRSSILQKTLAQAIVLDKTQQCAFSQIDSHYVRAWVYFACWRLETRL